ncbi:GNAT family N-acetyltransferase [Halobacillus salinarum]|uniref:GNAT family N-acetyltransferase n=1 Tax=Halobacillus salinarum TaxID=2932257 RepID=A0ABY4EG96_9BACI|nr:GNAT family N-acetyltransferase [Halobacillus salinarum]UOQ42918.1 GNAT family N-acetyltransferase [Halobacillus salinarum]
MNITFIPLTMQQVEEIASWNYEGFVEKVIMTPYFESFNKTGQLQGPGGCDGFAAKMELQTVGLFEYTLQDSTMEIGLALKPDLIGKGLGVHYVTEGIEFGIQHYNVPITNIKLVVDSKNEAAIRVYEKAGFKRVEQKENEIEMRKALLPADES